MIELKEEYEIYNFISKTVVQKQDLNIVINCNNTVFGRLLSVCAKILKKYPQYKIYLVNLDNIIFKKDFVHYSSKIKRIISAGDKIHGPFVETTSTKYIRYRFRNMVNKNKRFDIVKRLITWELPVITDFAFSISEKWIYKGFIYKELMNEIRS